MPHTLKNDSLELNIDFPEEHYNRSRYDWTGKITALKYKNRPISGAEKTDNENDTNLGKGLYNEFGIDYALGFNDAELGGWFHKIGVGLLQKETTVYDFNHSYKIKPATFKISTEKDRILICCESELLNGYAYILKKEIQLLEEGFVINYSLKNTGKKDIITDEYVHNFTTAHHTSIGPNYKLDFPFQIKPDCFEETLNPEGKVNIGLNTIRFNDTPKVPFFFSNLSGDENSDAHWELTHLKSQIKISETGNFKTDKVNVWGNTNVICPELFFKIHLKSGKTIEWSRTYNISNSN